MNSAHEFRGRLTQLFEFRGRLTQLFVLYRRRGLLRRTSELTTAGPGSGMSCPGTARGGRRRSATCESGTKLPHSRLRLAFRRVGRYIRVIRAFRVFRGRKKPLPLAVTYPCHPCHPNAKRVSERKTGQNYFIFLFRGELATFNLGFGIECGRCTRAAPILRLPRVCRISQSPTDCQAASGDGDGVASSIGDVIALS